MREIKFRARRVDGLGWAYGYLVKTPITAEFNDAHGAFFDSSSAEKTEWAGRYCVVTVSGVAHEIDIKTVGQFTGLLDKNGKEVYEGEIITCMGGYEVPEGTSGECEMPRLVKFDEDSLQYVAFCEDCGDSIPLYEFDLNEVIGNIHENPELIK